jgi:hypothetical protein
MGLRFGAVTMVEALITIAVLEALITIAGEAPTIMVMASPIAVPIEAG